LQKDAIANYKFSRNITGDIVQLPPAGVLRETVGQVGENDSFGGLTPGRTNHKTKIIRKYL